MDNNLTYIAVVLDESGSMQGVREETVGGFNTFIASQINQPGEARVTLVKFNERVSVPVFTDKAIKEVPLLGWETYTPNGCTALFDAIGKTINALGQRLSAMPENERPANVVVLIQTDGQENASREFTLEQIREMIKHQKEVYNWGFTFLGADIDAFATGGLFGLATHDILQYNKGASLNAFAAVSNYVSSARSVGTSNASYSQADRDLAVTADTK